MRDIDNLCVNCFGELVEGSVCANCGYDNDTVNDSMYLPAKAVLNGKYFVGAFVKHESDAATYMGYDSQLDKIVLIREFYPKGLVNRLEGSNEIHVRQKYIDAVARYKMSFYKLWTGLEKLHNLSAVVPVYDVFEENGTVYAIIEQIESIPLREYLLRNEDGYIAWDSARLMFMPVLTTIEALHSNGIVHGSITPDNLLLCRDGKVRLSPFTITESADITSDLEFNANDGYTALEQYENKHKICPATDIYAFSACIYRALVGTNPPDALSRESNDKLMIPNSIAETIPMHVIKALGNGLQIYPEKRIKSIADFRELLDAAPAVKAKAANYEEEELNEYNTDYVKATEPPKKSKKANIIIIILVILIVGAMAAGVYVVKFTDLVSTEEETSQTLTVETYSVPNFANNGYTQSDIENNGAWNEQFTITFTSDYSTDVEEGIVFKQSVAAGETVDAGTSIVLTVSKGIQTQTVPDVGSLTLEAATQQLEELGFKVSSVEVYNDGGHTPNTVKASYGMAPAAGEVVAVGEEIILQVYGEVQTTTQPATDANE
jgi:serine/threonine-protein kinase